MPLGCAACLHIAAFPPHRQTLAGAQLRDMRGRCRAGRCCRRRPPAHAHPHHIREARPDCSHRTRAPATLAHRPAGRRQTTAAVLRRACLGAVCAAAARGSPRLSTQTEGGLLVAGLVGAVPAGGTPPAAAASDAGSCWAASGRTRSLGGAAASGAAAAWGWGAEGPPPPPRAPPPPPPSPPPPRRFPVCGPVRPFAR